MGRTKTASGGGANSPSSDSNSASNTAQHAENRIKDLLKELYSLIHNVQVKYIWTITMLVVSSFSFLF